MIMKGLEGKSHRLRAIQENFEESYVKVTKKMEWKENAYQF